MPPGSDTVVIVSFGWIVIEKVPVAVCCGVPESFAVTITLLLVPAVVGVPLITPVFGSMERPAGALAIDQARLPVPPEAATVVFGYATFATPFGSEFVVIVSFDEITIVKVAVAVCCGVPESFAVTITLLLVPAVVGVPLITPVFTSMERPVGALAIDHIRLPVPPVAATVVLGYATFTFPFGSVVVVIFSCGAMVMEKVADLVKGVPGVVSVTVTCTLLVVPAADGVPVIIPVPELMERPAGRLIAAQLYGIVPPVALTVAL